MKSDFALAAAFRWEFFNGLDGAVHTNLRWQEMAGLSSEATLGDGWRQTIHPDDYATVLTRWEECRTQGREYKGEFRFLHPNGQMRWVLSRATAVYAQDNANAPELVGYVGTSEDITERKQIEAELDMRVRLSILRADIGMAVARTEALPIILPQECASSSSILFDMAFVDLDTERRPPLPGIAGERRACN
jgi:PAS domain S-box-containing protein